MKRMFVLAMTAVAVATVAGAARVDLYPQSFDAGGWSLDAQFMDVMGSPYLLAHGLGVRVTDATASVAFSEGGEYRVWVRTRNWADGNPGRFRVLIDGKPLSKVFGEGAREWSWEDGGTVKLTAGTVKVALEDLTGFDGRCAGLVFTTDGTKPDGALSVNDAEVAETVKADFVVVGGGLPGTCAAVAAARRGINVALIQDRPVLGGNASSEIRVWSGGEARYDLVRELRGRFMNRDVNLAFDDARRMRIVQDEKKITLRVLTRAFGVEKNPDGTIASVKALDLKSNRVVRFEAPLFCDATGDGWVGFWAGADWRMGREAKGEFDEDRAPEKSDGDTLGASLMWTSANANVPVPFSAPWAEPHARGIVSVEGEWNWEYGIHQDMIRDGEAIRDRLLLAIYGSFSLAKKKPENANKMLNLCSWLLGKRESRRIMGDWVYSQKDVTQNREFADAIASGSWGIDLHYDNYKKGVDFLTTCKGPQYGRYWIPYRSIYSRSVGNLFMAGRCFSCTHVGLGGPRVINTLSQLGVAAGEAAAMCREFGETPRGLYKNGRVRMLQERLGGGFPGVPETKTEGWTIIDDETPGVKFGKGWRMSRNCNGEQVGNWAHFPSKDAEPAVYPLPVTRKGRYALMGRVPYSWSARPGSKTAFVLTSGGVETEFFADQAQETGAWQKLGEFDLEPGATLKLVPAKSSGYLCADGFGLFPTDGRADVGLNLERMIRPVPESAVMRDPGYFVWGGSMVKDEKGTYHLYYARWKKEAHFSGWVTHSEIAHATGPSPAGPWTHRDVAIAPRGASYWDGLCAHNPNIHKFGDRYYLYYMGNTGDGRISRSLNWSHRNNQRIGVAFADSPDGPWTRLDHPVLDVSPDPDAPDSLMVSNPAAAQRPDGSFLLLYKAVGKKKKLPFGGPVVHLTATSKSPTGPFVKQLRLQFGDGTKNFPAEDPYVWSHDGKMFAIIKDQGGFFVNRPGRSLVLFESQDGLDWKLSAHPFIIGTTLRWASGKVDELRYLERPQLYLENGRPVALCVAAGPKDMKETFNVQIPLIASTN
ncbi:MAG: FAD-dependent oxidoreductase [Kiritimatiellae bacterium]|nr:FAD-dependent oxidoreductase [Kiritimatiellia bacterium]